MMLKSSSVWN